MKFSSKILFAVFAWSLLILRFGYRYGTGDQVELLPYTLFLHDSSLYPLDFFIRHLHASVPNERTVMATLLVPFVNHLELTCFLLQALSTIVLVLGLEKLAGRFIRNQYMAWAAVLIALIPLNDFTLGNVELYSECFQASGLATAIIVWAIHYFLNKRYTLASILMAAATFIQLLDGLDVMLVLCAMLFIAVVRRQIPVKQFLSFVLLYALTAGVYLVFIFIQKSGSGSVSGEEVFKIIFLFRHPHHFIFAAFPAIKVVVFFTLASVACLFFALRSARLFQFVLISLLGVIIYAVAVDGLHNILLANFQFYKVTAWVKFLGVVAVLGFAEELFAISIVAYNHLRLTAIGLLVGVILSWVIVIGFNNYLPYRVPFQLFGMKQADDMVAICRQIKTATPADAVFIQPFENTELKFYGQRSSYVEFKANVRNKAFINEWANRIEEVYGVSPQSGSGFALEKIANQHFYSLNTASLNALKQKGVTYLLAPKLQMPAVGTLILSNNTYAVYKL
jgi:hypothetical protein